MTTVAELYRRLNGDAWRIKHPFSDDIREANELLHNLAATEDEVAECLALWCLKRQPCQFGRAAAKQQRIHFCLLRDEAVAEWTDEEIAARIAEEKRLWKQRAAFDPNRAAFSFVIVVAAPRVALAAPDQQLRGFANRILELTGWGPSGRSVRKVNTITSDCLYLKNPSDGQFYGFRFNADFFACAGDGRWWHDHRFPGGIAFTANSTGHMMRFREWYEGKEDSEAWATKQAMLTIHNAAAKSETDIGDPIADGRVTWLRPLDRDGKPLLETVQCPFIDVPKVLEGKDWTRYEGLLHTDHAVREEFFVDREVAPTLSRPYLMDFTYLHDQSQDDFQIFSRGKLFAVDEVFAEIGRPSDWQHRAAAGGSRRSEEQAASVAGHLAACRRWDTPTRYVLDAEGD